LRAGASVRSGKTPPLLNQRTDYLQQLIQLTAIVKMFAKAFDEFFSGIAMALGPFLFETIDCRQGTDLAAQFPIEAA
jgi:hypothetical protein